MKNFYIHLKKFGNKLRAFFMLFPDYIYDITRYCRFSIMGGNPKNKEQYNALITRDYHKIEKALSFENFRPYSSKDAIAKILTNIESFSKKYGFDVPVKNAIHTLREYINVHIEKHIEDDFIVNLDKKVKQLEAQHKLLSWAHGGTAKLSSQMILDDVDHINPEKFFMSRHSIRKFSNKPVDTKIVERAFRLALKTPSVCNRQGWKGYLISNEELITKILSIHSGTRGFRETIKNLLIITGDLNHFNGANERNQVFVDGGMFAMSVVYALHSLGLASCGINWASDYYRDLKLRKIVKLKKHETVIMMVVLGNYPDTFYVAQSPRKNVEQVLEFITE